MAAGARGGAALAARGAALRAVDHLIYATPDLDRTIADLQNLTGVRASVGGSHPGRGTRNALMALGGACYLEIMGPDPAQPEPTQPRTRGIDRLQAARLVGWAARGRDLAARVALAASRGVDLGAPRAGSRRRPDGELLQWTFTDPNKILYDGLIPFLIDWGASPHPSVDAAQGCMLRSFELRHPQPGEIRRILRVLDLAVPVVRAARPGLVATLVSPRGTVVLS